MYEDFVTKMARVITEYSSPVQTGEKVVIIGNVACVPMVRAIAEAVVSRGAHAMPIIGMSGMMSYLAKYGTDEQLQFVNPFSKLAVEEADAILQVAAEINTKAASRIDPTRLQLAQQSNAPIFETMMQRIGEGSLRWTYFPFPTESMAQEAEMSLLDYTEFVYNACAFNVDDPVRHWQEVSAKQQKLVDYLADKSHARIVGPDIDLTFDFSGRKWINCNGVMNFPDGEIFTGPVEDSVNGRVKFNMRTVYMGRSVDGVELEFKDGKVVNASAEKNEEWLMSQLDLDEGARRLGEFAIGTNFGIQEITGNTLFDEKIGGSIHMAVGRSIPESLGTNMSMVHWDMVHGMESGEIYIDDELFYSHGEFKVEL